VERLADIGMSMNQAAITRIERGDRKVSVDEAFAIAVALDVAPLSLFLPIEGEEPVKLAPGRKEDPAKARRWARGTVPLAPSNFWDYSLQTSGELAVSAEGVPQEQLDAWREEQVRRIRQLGIPIVYEQQEPEPVKSKRTRKGTKR
jgi:transcriptional regulator with XRE-family HTH domain